MHAAAVPGELLAQDLIGVVVAHAANFRAMRVTADQFAISVTAVLVHVVDSSLTIAVSLLHGRVDGAALHYLRLLCAVTAANR